MTALLRLAVHHRRALVLLAWGTALLYLVRLGRYRTFLRPELGPVLVGGYLLVLLLLGAELFREHPGTARPALLLPAAVLLLPLLFLLNARGARLDAYAFQRRVTGPPRLAQTVPPPAAAAGPEAAPEAGAVAAPADLPGAARPVSLADLHLQPARHAGRRVAVEAMVFANDSARQEFGPGALLAFRFRVACCAADAQPVAVVVVPAEGQAAPRDNTWQRVEGRFTTRGASAGRGAVPVIEGATLRPIGEPREPYLY